MSGMPVHSKPFEQVFLIRTDWRIAPYCCKAVQAIHTHNAACIDCRHDQYVLFCHYIVLLVRFTDKLMHSRMPIIAAQSLEKPLSSMRYADIVLRNKVKDNVSWLFLLLEDKNPGYRRVAIAKTAVLCSITSHISKKKTYKNLSLLYPLLCTVCHMRNSFIKKHVAC